MIPVVLQLVIPVGLLVWLAYGRHRTRAGWLLALVLTGAYLVAVAVAGLWLMLPAFLPVLYLVLYLLALARSWRRESPEGVWPGRSRGWIGVGVRALLAACAVALAVYALSGWRAPSMPAIDLAFPLAGHGYLVANGGSTELLNAHLGTLSSERFRPYRGQSHGVDLVRLNGWGLRARGLLPRDPRAYIIFDTPVLAPCGGTVVEAADGFADMPPPLADRVQLAGNHVLLDCGDAWVLLGHFREGSVRVRTGDRVTIGQELGRVGNSGNTNEPHLHVHAQRPGTTAAPLSGQPLPIRFAGRYPVRNARFGRGR